MSSALSAMDNAMYSGYDYDNYNDIDIDIDMSEYHGFYDAEDHDMDDAYLEWYDAAEHYQEAYSEYVEALNGYSDFDDDQYGDEFTESENAYDSGSDTFDDNAWANAVVMDGEDLYDDADHDGFSNFEGFNDDDALSLYQYDEYDQFDDIQSAEYGDYESFENEFGADFDDRYNYDDLYDDQYLRFDDGANEDEGYYHQFHYEVIGKKESDSNDDDNDEDRVSAVGSVGSVPDDEVTDTNWYWMFELVFMAAVMVGMVFMFVSVQKDEWMQSLKTLNEQRVNRRKYGFNRINVVFDTTADDSGSDDALSEDEDHVQQQKLMEESSDSGDEHLGSNPSLSQESQ